MTPRFIIRPPGIMTTPRKLVEVLGARSTRNGARFRYTDPRRDLLLYYPAGLATEVSLFASRTKQGQRKILSAAGIPVPNTGTSVNVVGGTNYIVRPLRHRGGEGWRLTQDPTDYNPSTEYIQELYPKTHEYRVVFCFGEPLFTLLKKVDEGTPVDQPWNHTYGSRFITVQNEENNRLRYTDAVERLKNNNVVQTAHLVAADIMYNKHDRSYVVAELNFCPALTIEDNLRKVAERVNQVSF